MYMREPYFTGKKQIFLKKINPKQFYYKKNYSCSDRILKQRTYPAVTHNISAAIIMDVACAQGNRARTVPIVKYEDLHRHPVLLPCMHGVLW